MKRLFLILLLLPLSLCYAQSATPGTILTFYITDLNLSTEHRAVMTIPTAGLVDFTINGVSVPGPAAMVETGIDTGTFQIQLTLPDSVNGEPLQGGDVVVMTYHEKADYSGNPTTLTQSVVLTNIVSSPVSGSSSNVMIGHYFTLSIYAPNYNLDSQTPDDIPLNMVEVHMGGAQTTLADPIFQANPYTLRETGPNTDTFAVTVKIPTEIAGAPVYEGSTLEFRFDDPSNPSSVFVTVGGSSGQSVTGSYGSTNMNSNTNAAPYSSAPSLVFYAPNSAGTSVNYLNSTILSGLQSPICSPPSGSFFPTGTTTVTCAAKDQNGNSIIKSFVIDVVVGQDKIPSWIKKTVGFWCNGYVDDSQLSSLVNYLVSNNMMIVQGESEISGQVPDKTLMCSWANGTVSDQDVAQSLYLFSR
ncbi:MAG: hypothetical protein WBV92_03575 [Nitrosotalea sp.]